MKELYWLILPAYLVIWAMYGKWFCHSDHFSEREDISGRKAGGFLAGMFWPLVMPVVGLCDWMARPSARQLLRKEVKHMERYHR